MAQRRGGPDISPDEALQRLLDGNQRFIQGEPRFGGLRKEVLADLAKGQSPHTTILGCSDSRVPPELVFDAGVGELFVVRVAGNVLSSEIAGSLQYARAHLHTPLFVVLGHEGCGAVDAALAYKYQRARHRSRIQILVDSILPGLPDFDPHLTPRTRLSQAVEANVRWTMRQILQSVEDRTGLTEGRTKLMGAIYELESGHVRFLE